MDACSWCGEAPWTFSCATCDPRRTKRVCDACAKRWHTRGASRVHVLTNRAGETKAFHIWLLMILEQSAESRAAVSSITTSSSSSNSGDVADSTLSHGVSAPQLASADAARSLPAPTAVIADVQQSATASPQPAEHPQPDASIAADDTDVLASSCDTSANPSVDGGDDAASISNNTEEQQQLDDEQSEPKLMPLNELLSLLPSDEPRLIDALSEYIHAAVRTQDAITCVRFVKCTDPVCVRAVEIFQHGRKGEPPCDTACRLGAEMYAHMRACTRPGCPFCIRVRLRKALNSIRALESFVAMQKRTMKQLLQRARDDDAKAKYNFCVAQVRDSERKRLQLIDDVEGMNSVVLNKRLPIFNFPKPAWHIDAPVVIKTEQVQTPPAAATEQAPTPLPAATEAEQHYPSVTEQPAAVTASPTELPSVEPPLLVDNGPHVAEGNDDDNNNDDGDDETGGAESDELMVAAGLDGDHICAMMDKMHSDPCAQQAFNDAIELAYAIVEASFCSPAKSQRCLLQCQRIHDHLQHHLDLNVCAEVMCMAVEFHFAHLSMCTEAGTSDDCEYCLRVKERELMRALDIMVNDEREAKAKAQAVMKEMSKSLVLDTEEEHEITVSILGDELEQTREYIRDMGAKLNASRATLSEVRAQMARHLPQPVVSSAGSPLPQHYAKIVKKGDTKRQPPDHGMSESGHNRCISAGIAARRTEDGAAVLAHEIEIAQVRRQHRMLE